MRKVLLLAIVASVLAGCNNGSKSKNTSEKTVKVDITDIDTSGAHYLASTGSAGATHKVINKSEGLVEKKVVPIKVSWKAEGDVTLSQACINRLNQSFSIQSMYRASGVSNIIDITRATEISTKTCQIQKTTSDYVLVNRLHNRVYDIKGKLNKASQLDVITPSHPAKNLTSRILVNDQHSAVRIGFDKSGNLSLSHYNTFSGDHHNVLSIVSRPQSDGKGEMLAFNGKAKREHGLQNFVHMNQLDHPSTSRRAEVDGNDQPLSHMIIDHKGDTIFVEGDTAYKLHFQNGAPAHELVSEIASGLEHVNINERVRNFGIDVNTTDLVNLDTWEIYNIATGKLEPGKAIVENAKVKIFDDVIVAQAFINGMTVFTQYDVAMDTIKYHEVNGQVEWFELHKTSVDYRVAGTPQSQIEGWCFHINSQKRIVDLIDADGKPVSKLFNIN
ncbi:hypothetical protein VTH8203_03760 [Vibrio thalassae]|uniref:Lipoprotein n=1 Tax=Vibrio thalassae TaxID=1243014 RepID=A0A240EN37_9VIBR|nr:hypothetical protein [Vibrio thalassae]SNX50112.1 hypothetical protein VTH8203_03760 [Vibrio thalassae]